ncbi:MAG: PD-(D/E)XK nuclease family protein [Eubacteriales bacterium]|nr:PD-(D/E)XK nuclease family protein [Eubacteriales bacterium]
MGLRLLYGPISAALRDHCLDEVVAWTERWPDKRAIVIVPEQAKLDFEQAYLNIKPQGGLLMAEILSFRRLASRLGAEVGLNFPRQIDQSGQAMILYRILQEQKDQLQIFAHLADKPGFIREIAAVLGDLRRSFVDPVTLSAITEQVADISLRHKIHDLSVLQRFYAESIDELQLTDVDDSMDQLIRLLNDPPALLGYRLEWLTQTAIWVIGFGETRNFTPQEFAVIEQLERRCAQLTVTNLSDSLPADALAAEHGPDYFLPGRRTAWTLRQRFDLKQVQKIAPAQSTPAVRLILAQQPQDQIAWLAGEIRRLVLSGSYRYRDIGIAVCRPAEDLPRLQIIFNQFNIPLFLDQVRHLSGTALMRTVLSLIDIASGGWTRQPVMRLLRAGLMTVDQHQVDQLENELLAKGLFRFDRLLDEKPELFKPIDQFTRQLKSVATGSEKVVVLRDYLDQIDLQNRCATKITELTAQGATESALALAKSWNALAVVLDQLAQLTQATPMSLAAFRGLIAAGLDNADSGVLPTALDQVAVGNLARSRQRTCKVLFVLGADSQNLPPTAAPEGLLKDYDRESLSVHLSQPLPNHARDQIYADAALIHSLLQQPTEQLVLIAPEEDPSPYCLRYATQYGIKPEPLPASLSSQDVRLNAPQPALNRLLQFSREPLAEPDEEAGFHALAAALIRLGWPLQTAQRWLLRDDPLTVRIDPDLVEERFSKTMTLSVSQLEKYAECPFRHFAAYGLKLQDRAIYEPEAAESGSLLHAITEQSLTLLRALIDTEADPHQAAQLIQRWLDHELDTMLAQVLQAISQKPEHQAFFAPGLHASIGRRLERVARTSLIALVRQLLTDEYSPSQFEWSFGQATNNALRYPLDDTHTVVLNGIVDRIDVQHNDGGNQFRIIDYKSGNQKVDYEKIYHGLALQLPAYLTAYAANHAGQTPVDACYFHFDEPLFNQETERVLSSENLAKKLDKHFKLRSLNLAPAQLAVVQHHVAGQIKKWSNEILNGEFSARPRHLAGSRKACEFCGYAAVCGTDYHPSHSTLLEKLGGLNEMGQKVKKKDDLLRRLEKEADHAPIE